MTRVTNTFMILGLEKQTTKLKHHQLFQRTLISVTHIDCANLQGKKN